MTFYLSGCTNDRHEERLIAAGCGLLIQPGTTFLGFGPDRNIARIEGWFAQPRLAFTGGA